MKSQAWEILPSPSKTWRSPEALNNLHLNTSLPTPTSQDLSPTQILVRIHAASINARDLMVIAHDPAYPVINIPSLSPCADGSGEVIAAGSSSKWNVGDKVVMHPLPGYTTQSHPPTLEEMRGRGAGSVQGMLRQFGVFDDEECFSPPSHLSFEEAAAIPAAGATAVNALFYSSLTLKPGMTVLTMGTGGVSCAAIQFASSLGIEVIATSSSATKLQQATSLGATHVVNYTDADWIEQVKAFTKGGEGVDLVVDVVGDLEASLACVKAGGVVALVGFLDQDAQHKAISSIMLNILIRGKIVRGVPGFNTEHVRRAVEITGEFGLRPLMEVFEWVDAREAFEKSMERSVVGKVVIKV